MSKVTNKREQGTSLNSVALKLTPIATGCAILLAAASGSAFAQEAVAPKEAVVAKDAAKDADAPATIVVTGIRRGIEAAISIKKNASSIVEAISAEDIGKLPDSSVASSIARLPGVTAQRNRSSGKSSDVSIRGLAPSFNGSLLNGREQASTGNARSPEFDLFPSELMGSVMIYKTPDAALIGQGLAATIDLRTLQPLDFPKRQLVAKFQKERSGVKSGVGEGDGDRLSFSYVDQFANRTIGVALSATRFKENGADQAKFNSWGGWTPTLPFNGNQVKLPGGFTADTESSKNNRDGLSASLQFRPNKNFKSTVDVFYSSGSWTQKKTGLEGAIGGNANGAYDPAGVLSNVVVDANGNATSGTLSNYKAVIRNHQEKSEDKLTSLGWNTTMKAGEWTAVADLAHSKASKDNSRFETTAGLPGDATSLDTISWTGFNGGNFSDVKYTTGLNYGDRNVAKLTDVNGWSGGFTSPQAGYVALPTIDDTVDSLRLTAKRDVSFGPIVAAQFGFNMTDRKKSRTGQEGRLVIAGGNPYGVATVPGTEVGIAGTTGLPVVSFDPSGSLGTIYSISQKVDADILNKDWNVKEKVNTAFVMGDLDSELFGLPYRGNVGTQLIHTDQKGTGYAVDTSKCTGNTAATCPAGNVTSGTTYTDVLPSANVSFELGSEQFVRFGVAKVLSRANMDDLRGGGSFGVTTIGDPILSGGGGNPLLKPFRATALDVSFEKYFGNKGYFSVAGFYKKLDTYILRSSRKFDFAPFVGPNTPLPLTGPHAGSTIGLMTQPTNGEGGNIHGFEVSVNIPFSMVSEYLDGFGVSVNHSDTSSAITLPSNGFGTSNISGTTISLPGLSKRVSNLRLYYEKAGFQFAAAARQRSDFLGGVSDFQDNQMLSYVKGETLVDFQVSYEFKGGWFKDLSLFAQAINWNNAPYQEYNTDRNVVTNKVVYGRSYQFGANYKF